MVEKDGKKSPKKESDYNQPDVQNTATNHRNLNVLCCALDANEFDRVSACDTVKKMWDKLVLTYDGTSHVKKSKIDLLVHQCESCEYKQKTNISYL